jgi:hypothetical protein
MGRKKKSPKELRGTVSITVLPNTETRLATLATIHQATKSAMAERLLSTGIQIAELDNGFRKLLDPWQLLNERDRRVVLRLALQSRATVIHDRGFHER